MIHIPPEVQAAAGIPAAQALQCSFSGFCHAIRREHFAQAQLVRGQLFFATLSSDEFKKTAAAKKNLCGCRSNWRLEAKKSPVVPGK